MISNILWPKMFILLVIPMAKRWDEEMLLLLPVEEGNTPGPTRVVDATDGIEVALKTPRQGMLKRENKATDF